MASIPILMTERLLLRSFLLSDVKRTTELLSDHRITDTAINIPTPYTEDIAQSWILTHTLDYEDNKNCVHAITNRDTGEIVGSVGLVFNNKYNSAELGYWIGTPYWNMGYATEAAKRILRFAFEDLNFHRVFAHYIETNVASGKVMEKIGMKKEGILRDAIKHNNKYESLVMYGILAPDFKN